MKPEKTSTWAEAQQIYNAKCEELSYHPAFEPLAELIIDRRAVHPDDCEYESAISLMMETHLDNGEFSISGYTSPEMARECVRERVQEMRSFPDFRRIRGTRWRYWQRQKLLIADLLAEAPAQDVKEVWELMRENNVVPMRPVEDVKPAAAVKPKEKAFHFMPLSEISDEPLQFRIAGMVPQDGITVIFGKPKSGKTFAAIDMASCVATGRDYHGRAVKPGKVVYIAGEGRSGIRARFKAWAIHNGADPMGNVLLSSGAAMIGVQTHLAQVAQAIHAATKGETPAMIVVDTLKRNFGPGNEDKGEDMSRFVQGLDRLRELFPGVTIIVVHHSGHHDDERAMGSINLLAAVDAEYRVKKGRKERMKLECTNPRDFEEPEGMEFDMVKVSGSLVPVFAGAVQQKESPLRKEADAAIEAWDAVAEFAFADGQQDSVWRQAFYEIWDKGEEANKKAFQRARKQLTEAGLLTNDNDLYQLQRDKRDGTGQERDTS